jgi:hypothetical protein
LLISTWVDNISLRSRNGDGNGDNNGTEKSWHPVQIMHTATIVQTYLGFHISLHASEAERGNAGSAHSHEHSHSWCDLQVGGRANRHTTSLQ